MLNINCIHFHLVQQNSNCLSHMIFLRTGKSKMTFKLYHVIFLRLISTKLFSKSWKFINEKTTGYFAYKNRKSQIFYLLKKRNRLSVHESLVFSLDCLSRYGHGISYFEMLPNQLKFALLRFHNVPYY